MEKLITLMMYVLWVITVVMGLLAIFTDFKYDDLNIMALLFLVFTALNTFFVVSKKKSTTE